MLTENWNESNILELNCGSVETEIRMFSAWLDPVGPPPLLCSLSQSALMPRIDLEKMLRPRRQYKIKKQTAPSSALLQLADTALMLSFKTGASFHSLLLSETIMLIQHNIPFKRGTHLAYF